MGDGSSYGSEGDAEGKEVGNGMPPVKGLIRGVWRGGRLKGSPRMLRRWGDGDSGRGDWRGGDGSCGGASARGSSQGGMLAGAPPPLSRTPVGELLGDEEVMGPR